MGTTSLLISSTLSKKEKKLDHLEREFQKARLELEIEEENLWQSYRKDRRQLEEEFAQDKVS